MKKMRMVKLFLLTIGVGLGSLAFHACSDGYSLDKFWVEIATIESTGSGSHHFRLDDGATLWPAAGYYKGHNLEDGQRVWLNYTILSDSLDGFSHYVKVNGLDVVLTKKIAEDLGEENDSFYGNDPVSIKSLWIGSGYLNVLFAFNYGGEKRHFINLLSKQSEEDPYTLEFRHNAYEDPAEVGVRSIVCFDLSDLPDTNGETVKLKIRVKTFEGDKTIELDYNSEKQEDSKRVISSDNSDYFERVN